MPTLFEDPAPQYRDDAGEIVAGGELRFTSATTTLAKDVYADRALGTSLGDSVTLDAAGRAPTAIWLADDGLYNVELVDADAAQVWLREDVGTAADSLLPLDPADGEEDQVYSTDGVDAYWRTILEVPDPTGHSGKYVGTDGTAVQWTAFPEATVYDDENLPGGITQGSTSFQVGKFLVQTGSGTIPTAAGVTASVAKTFGTAYATLLHVDIQITGSGGSTPQGAKPGISYVGTTTGFTAYAYAADEHDSPGWTLTSTTPFTYVAYGLVA